MKKDSLERKRTHHRPPRPSSILKAKLVLNTMSRMKQKKRKSHQLSKNKMKKQAIINSIEMRRSAGKRFRKQA